jgi:hypothetical protein
MESQPDMFDSSEELVSQDSAGGLPSSGIVRQESDSSWTSGTSPGSSQNLVSWDKDQLFLVTMAAMQSLFV